MLLDGLESDSYDVTHKLPDRIEESTNLLEERWILGNAGPEQRKVTLLQDISQVNDFLDRVVVHLGRQQQTLAQDKIGVGEVGQSFQQNYVRHVQVHQLRIELIELQTS